MYKEKIKDFLNLIDVMNEKLDYNNRVNYTDAKNDIALIVEMNETLQAENETLKATNESLERELSFLRDSASKLNIVNDLSFDFQIPVTKDNKRIFEIETECLKDESDITFLEKINKESITGFSKIIEVPALENKEPTTEPVKRGRKPKQ